MDTPISFEEVMPGDASDDAEELNIQPCLGLEFESLEKETKCKLGVGRENGVSFLVLGREDKQPFTNCKGKRYKGFSDYKGLVQERQLSVQGSSKMVRQIDTETEVRDLCEGV
ncbi:hypothetical protein JHK87_022812 [Glycine soja]|nr:hypothetical protein JHK87_022812 [Glycine soja]